MKSPNTKWLDKAKGRLYLTYLLIFLFLFFSSFLPKVPNWSNQKDALDTIPRSQDIIKQINGLKYEITSSEASVFSNSKLNTRESKLIWNPKVYNTKEKDEISLFVFDENNRIDSVLTQRIKSEFLKKDYIITDEIIFYNAITPQIASKLKSRSLDFFNGNLYKSTDYICIGIVSYSYESNYYRRDLIDCTMQINYYIYSASTGVIMFSENDRLIGSGQTKKMSRLSAIHSFIL